MQDAGTCSGSETLEQAGDHFLYLEKFGFDFVVSIDFNHPQIPSQQQKVLKFAGRSHGNIQKLPQLAGSSATAAFGDVRRNRTGRPSDLAAQPKSFVWRKFTGEFVSLERKSVAPAPNVEFTKILHEVASIDKSKPRESYLQLNTNNCQLSGGGCYAD